MRKVYRYRFSTAVALEEVEASLLLAIFSVESLHGEAAVMLDGRHYLDENERVLIVDAQTRVGQDLNRIFINFLRREFRSKDVTIERTQATIAYPTEEVAS